MKLVLRAIHSDVPNIYGVIRSR